MADKDDNDIFKTFPHEMVEALLKQPPPHPGPLRYGHDSYFKKFDPLLKAEYDRNLRAIYKELGDMEENLLAANKHAVRVRQLILKTMPEGLDDELAADVVQLWKHLGKLD